MSQRRAPATVFIVVVETRDDGPDVLRVFKDVDRANLFARKKDLEMKRRFSGSRMPAAEYSVYVLEKKVW